MDQLEKKERQSPKQVNRATLYEYFENGMRPNVDDFKDLIYSSINVLDDGISKSFENGLKLSPQSLEKVDAEAKINGKVISFYEVINGDEPSWTISLTGEKGAKDLCIASGKTKETLLKISQDGNIELLAKEGSKVLQVNGDIAMSGRIGNYKQDVVRANGNWHTIIDNLEGCKMFEVIAMAHSESGEGKYASIHAIASNAFTGKRGRIHCNRNHYGWQWWKRIGLRWVGSPFNYKLQIKTFSDYGKDGKIEFSITQLNKGVTYNKPQDE